MELGGNIELINFEDVEPGKLVVIKKIVGNFTKQVSDSQQGFEKITVELVDKENNTIKGTLTIEGKTSIEEAADDNLFFALNSMLNKLLKK